MIDAQGIATDIDTDLVQSLTLALVDRARAKKTTVAKLSRNDERKGIRWGAVYTEVEAFT